MKHHAYVFFLLVLIFPTLLYPQNIDVDSLLKVLSQKNHDTIKISASLDLAWYYMYTKTDSAIFYAEKALNLSQANNYKENISASYIALGICYNTKTEYSKALSYLNKSLKIENELLSKNPDFSSYKRGLLVTNLDIGNIYFFQGNYAQAIEHYFQTLKLAEEIDFKKAICLSSGNIGLCYKDLKDYTKALEYNYKALGVAIETGNKSDLHQCYNNLGDIYFVMSELDSAKMYFTNCLNINKEDNNEPNLVKTYVNLANVYTKEKKYDKALRYYKLSLELSEKLDLKDGQINVNFMMGKYFSLLKNYKSAINHFTKSLELAKEIGNLQFVMQTNNELSLLYQNIGDYKKALQYYIDKSITEDSIFTLKSNEKIAGIEARYEIEQKDNEIAKQKLQIEKESKRRNYLIFGSIALLLLVILIYQWIANRQKRKNKETELALKLKKAESKNLKELNNAKSRFFANITHEFRTPLTLIMGPLQDVIGKIKGEDKEILKIAHSNSKKLLTLVNDILDLSTVEEGSPELNKSETCILSFLKRIFYSYESYAKIRQIGTEIVIAEGNDVLVNIDLAKLEKIINNLLSNAFKYTESGGSVKLLVDMKKDTVFITVKDTGVGIDEKDIKYIFERYYQGLNSENITGTGIGLSFANRLAKMMGGKISVESKRKEGSIFTLQLPIVIIKECIEDLGALQGGINIEEKADYKVKAIFADKPRILIVEDNYEMQKYLSGILKEYFHIDLAENGFEGLKKLKE
ncbi:MAG TPA: tetratricopeptide repeat protein, partial [Bacteroidetes bacterium]|nr:tetratricopeptide repeat protein [Bacteroidota bacterium]